MIVEKIVDFVDEYYHLKRIGKYLSKLNLVECANIGSHKGEFLKHLVKIKSIKKIHRRGAGDPGTRFQAPKRVGPPIKTKTSSANSKY